MQSHDRSVELFRIRTEEEVQKKQLRRKKRAKEKKDKQQSISEKADNEKLEDDEITLVSLFTPHVIVRASKKIRSFDFGVSLKDGLQVR